MTAEGVEAAVVMRERAMTRGVGAAVEEAVEKNYSSKCA